MDNKLFKLQVIKQEEGIFKVEKVINIGESYFTEFYQIFTGTKLNNSDLLEGILKVELSPVEGFEQLRNGIEFDGRHYEEIITTPSGMKREDDDFKCESFFYDTELLRGIKEKLYEVISAGKLQELEGQEIAINKMVSSRLALATSTVIGATKLDLSRVFVADEYTYNYIGKYSWFENDKLIEGEKELTHTAFDGQGLMSPRFAEKKRKSLGLDYRIDFSVVRAYSGLAIKGVLLRFDFKKYYESMNITEIVDYYGKSWNIEDIDIIVNPSMVKWLGLHNNITDTESYYKDTAYQQINSKLYITKTNKSPKKLKDKIRLNYQALTNTSISAEELKQLAKDEIETYKKISSYDTEESLNLIRLALGADDATDSVLGLTLDKLGLKALKLAHVRLTVKSILEKQIKELSGGKILVDGLYSIACIDPVAFCNRIIGVENSELELQAGEIVQGGAEIGNRVIYRNPIAYYDEVKSITLSSRDYLKYYSRECLFFNSKDDTLMRSSGADMDGDGFAIINNDIFYNSTIKCEYPYWNSTDGATKKLIYNKDNYAYAIWESTGNLIGKIALNNTKLCCECSSYSAIVNNGKVALRKDIKEAWKKAFKIENTIDRKIEYDEWKLEEDRINKEFKTFLKEQGFKYTREFSAEEQKEFRIRLFYLNREKFFKILEASQQAIDTCKTLQGITPELQKDIKEATKGLKKPYFMLNLGKATKEEVTKFQNNNPLDEFCKYIEKDCLAPFRKALKTDSGCKGNKEFCRLFGNPDTEENEELYKIYKRNSTNRNLMTKEELLKEDTIATLKLMILKPTKDEIASTGYKHTMSVRFLMSFFADALAEGLNEMQSQTKELVEDPEGEILFKGKRYKAVEREIDANISKEDYLKEMVRRGVYKRIRVYNPEGINIESNDIIDIAEGRIGDLQVIKSGKEQTIIADGKYLIKDYKIDDSNIRATVWLIPVEAREIGA